MPRFKGRSVNACHYCRSQKTKCSGEQPCTRCRASQRSCVYSHREKLLTVPESYLRRMENEISQLRRPTQENQRPLAQESTVPLSNGLEEQTIPDRLIENSTTEHFVRKLKNVYSTRSQDIPGVSPLSTGLAPDQSNFHDNDDQSAISDYTYIPLDNDSNNAKIFIKLPPHSYALYLLGQFETFMGSDYHWYKKKSFRAKIEATYDSSRPQTVDRIWICCFSVVLALGESYNDGASPSFFIGDQTGLPADGLSTIDSQQVAPPGIEFFKQALLLLRPSYEEPTIEQVEALNLITFYCYSLNRRKTAYAYAGMALRLANLLGLPNSTTAHDPLEQEHRRRIWWTTVCMDIMTCTELSLAPCHALEDGTNIFPSNIDLPLDEAEEFSDRRYLTAQVKLVRIKYRIIKTISELRYGNAFEARALIEPCLQILQAWREEFSLNLEFGEDGGFSENTISNPSMRTVASLLLRYNQCFIILLRPLLLKQLQDLFQKADTAMPNTELDSLNIQCLQAAVHNTLIQFALSKCHKIAKFGFWDSLHIFSSLTVHLISRFIRDRSLALCANTPENVPYEPVKHLLAQMAREGNAASKDHNRMIDEIEAIFTENSSNIGIAEGIESFEDWPDYLGGGNWGFEFDETFPSVGWLG